MSPPRRWPALADVSHLPIPGTDVPSRVSFTPDGAALTYLHAPGSLVAALWRHEIESGRRTLLAGPSEGTQREELLGAEERLRRERRRTTALGVTEYRWLTDGPVPVLLVPMGGRAWVGVGDRRHERMRPVAGIEAASAVVGAPDGRRAAFVRDGEVWVASLLDDGQPRRLTHDASDGIFNGLPEYAAAEELDRFEGLWWSADARHIAYAHVDERGIPPLAISQLAAARPSHEEHRYPFAGGPNARVELRVVPVESGEPVRVPLPMAEDDYLARVVAHPHGGWLVAILPRTQRSLSWCRVGADGAMQELWTETSDPWLNLDHDTRVLPDGRILRSAEGSGHRHLELRDPDGGRPRRLTGGRWDVSAVTHVDATRDELLFVGTGHGVTERHLYRVPLDGDHPCEKPERLTAEAGWHEIAFSADGERWADIWSDLASGARLVVHERPSGGPPRTLCAPRADAASLGIRSPELLRLTAADGETPLWAALYLPDDAAVAAGPPPCVVWVYGGPHAQYVRRAWETTAHPLRQYLAAAGAAVLVVDNRGSANRGLAFESPLHDTLGTPEVADQAAAVRQLADRGVIDASRVAITGGSYGGYITLRAMALEPDLFRVGVALAPVTAWDGYDTAYTERYLGRPLVAAAAYAASSALEVASRIRGSLLVIHGAIDENVHLRHSLRLISALQDAGRDVELVILPEDRHRTRTPGGLRTRDRRTARHLLAGLGLPLPAELGGG